MRCGGEESFLRLVSVASQALRNYADQRLKKYNLTLEQLQVLKQLDSGQGIAHSQISSVTDKSPANTTRILDRLEKKQWISRLPNPDDRRSSLVILTKSGDELLNKVTAGAESFRAELLQGISSENQHIAVEVLQAIMCNIEKKMSDNN